MGSSAIYVLQDLCRVKNVDAVNAGTMEPEELGVHKLDDRTLVMELEQPCPYLPYVPLGSCSLGQLISEGFANCLLHPYKLLPCMVILVLLMIACNLVADGLREAFDTRMVR